MELKKLWENTESDPEYTNVCDVYGAEHLARLIGMNTPDFFQRLLALTDLATQYLSPSC
jgi:mortality factor 4-like protein 1